MSASKKPQSAGIRAAMEALPNRAYTRNLWDDERDALLVEFWHRKRQTDVARLLHVNVNTARCRYRELTEEK